MHSQVRANALGNLMRTYSQLTVVHSPSAEVLASRVGPAQLPALKAAPGSRGKVYMETYGCQMNVNDSEVWAVGCSPSRGGWCINTKKGAVKFEVAWLRLTCFHLQVVLAVLQEGGFALTEDLMEADVVLLNTCAIREKAEQRVWARLAYFRSLKRPSTRGARRQLPGQKAAASQDQLFGAKNAPLGAGVVVGVLGCMAERLKNQILEADRFACSFAAIWWQCCAVLSP